MAFAGAALEGRLELFEVEDVGSAGKAAVVPVDVGERWPSQRSTLGLPYRREG